MSIQTVLESWRDYIDPIEFDQLTDFFVRTEAVEKLNKILVLEGQGSTGKSTFVRNITDSYFGLHHYDLSEKLSTTIDEYDGKPSPSSANLMEREPKLIVFSEQEFGSNFDDKLRTLVSNPDIIYRALYSSRKIGKIKGNFVMMAYPNQLGTHLDDILIRTHFNHQF